LVDVAGIAPDMHIADASSAGLNDAGTRFQPTKEHLRGLEVCRYNGDLQVRAVAMDFQENRLAHLPTERPDRLKRRVVRCNNFVTRTEAGLLSRRSIYDGRDRVMNTCL